jgi:hypothetical protein
MLSALTPVGSFVSAGLLLGILSAAFLLLRRRFPAILCVFSCSFFGAEFLKTRPQTLVAAFDSGAPAADQVLYLILDGQIGVSGFPASIPACARARATLQRTLDTHAFTTYPNATSNYGVTLLSIPSILNQELLTEPEQFTRNRTPGGAIVVSPNRLFEEFASRGYQVAVYQHRSINFAAGSPHVQRRVEYSSEISGLEYVPGWSRRVLWLIGDYQGSERLLSIARGFLPFRVGYRRTGALAVRSIWPSRVASDILHAKERTLFFVHLITPHEPYVYRADGSVREFSEWTPDTPVPPLGRSAYETRYSAYCEQVMALSGQLDVFLQQLYTGGALDTMTVVIHSDHGSRIYLKDGDERINLLNQFSALLAIRQPSALLPAVNDERASVMSLLSRDFRGKPVHTPKTDLVFWADRDGVLQPTPVQHLWR